MAEPKSTNIHWHSGNFTIQERWESLGVHGCTLWFTGFSIQPPKNLFFSEYTEEIEKCKMEQGSLVLESQQLRALLNKFLSNERFMHFDLTEITSDLD